LATKSPNISIIYIFKYSYFFVKQSVCTPLATSFFFTQAVRVHDGGI